MVPWIEHNFYLQKNTVVYCFYIVTGMRAGWNMIINPAQVFKTWNQGNHNDSYILDQWSA
jgi:hypothetical protein